MLKKCCVFLLALLLFLAPSNAFAAEQKEGKAPSVSAESAVLINGDTLEVVYEKDSQKQLSMASTTKIMTSILALEQGNVQQVVEITPEMVNVEGTSIGLKAGDYITLETLVAGMLLESGNDAANAVACAVGGDQVRFAELMNAKASEIGMRNTNFVTPSGLDHEEHYTTAYDMALLGAYALKNPAFKSICSSKSMAVSFGNPASKRTFSNHNKMLSLYDGAIGIKTGFTKKSGRCLVSAAERDGVQLIAVTLNAPNDWDDTAAMFDYGFSRVELLELDAGRREFQLDVVGGVNEKVNVALASPVRYSCLDEQNLKITTKIYLRHFEYAPVKQGDILGYSCYYNNGELICRMPLVAEETVEALPLSGQTEKPGFKQKIEHFITNIKEFLNHGKQS